jgi:hypothetical protein
MKHNKLKYHKLLLYVTAIAILVAQSQARPAMLVNSYNVDSFDDSVGDPLDPGILGESMSMPQPLEIVRAAIDAGIVKDSKALYAYDDGLGGYAGSGNKDSKYTDSGNALTPKSGMKYPIEQSPQNVNVNVTGPWSLDLNDQIKRHLDLALIQNKGVILGHGIIDSPNGTQRVTASGSLTGGRLSLTAMLIDSLDLYKLNLSFNSNTVGTYTAYSANGATWSGDVSGSAPSGISNPSPKISETKPETAKEADIASLDLAKPGQRLSTGSGTSIGVSSASGTNSVDSYSSISESAQSSTKIFMPYKVFRAVPGMMANPGS